MKEKYLRMLKKMEENAAAATPAREWSVYMLRCADGSVYTGVAKDVAARFEQHAKGKGAAYTRAHPPLEIIRREDGYTRSGALIREAAIKRLPKPKKLALALSGANAEASNLCKTKKSRQKKS